jgi:hypothetical protein
MSLLTPDIKAQLFAGLVDNLDGNNAKLGKLIDVKVDEATIGVDKQKLEMFDAIAARVQKAKDDGADGNVIARLNEWLIRYSS